VAIDFQLYALFTLLLWLAGRSGERTGTRRITMLVIAAMGCSLLYFNREPEWDVSALYFFGSYCLGIIAWWASDPDRSAGRGTFLVLVAAVLTAAALFVDFRERIALALAVAEILFLFGRSRAIPGLGRTPRLLDELGKISYSIFLVHFPVCLVVNAMFTRFVPVDAEWQAVGTVLACAANVVAGVLFFRWVEAPLGRTTRVHSAAQPVRVFNELARKDVVTRRILF
jgi:peptidoglycan/LPS O-acetylase OafA/YrhL